MVVGFNQIKQVIDFNYFILVMKKSTVTWRLMCAKKVNEDTWLAASQGFRFQDNIKQVIDFNLDWKWSVSGAVDNKVFLV